MANMAISLVDIVTICPCSIRDQIRDTDCMNSNFSCMLDIKQIRNGCIFS